ncbi:MAG TPA: replication initiator, partial [Acidimicrobiales bacterium]
MRLVGSTTRISRATGQIIDHYSSAQELDGITWVRCGDRRAQRCESCSREYKGDAWHLLSAGLTGGKGAPDTVVE